MVIWVRHKSLKQEVQCSIPGKSRWSQEGHHPLYAPVPRYCVSIVLYYILYYVIVSYFIITQGNSRQTKRYLLGNEGNACY